MIKIKEGLNHVMLSDEKINEIASKYIRAVGDYSAYENTIPENSIEDFARDIENYVLKITTSARFKAHLKCDECSKCKRPFYHAIIKQEKH